MARPSLTAVPAQRSSLPVLKIRRRVVMGLCVGASAIGLFSGIAWLSAPDVEPVRVAARDDAAVALATTVAQDYVLGTDTLVPVANGISATFSQTNPGALPGADVTFAGTTQVRLGDQQALTVQRSTFHVSVSGVEESHLYELTVSMAMTSRGWILAAAPSLAPLPLAESVVVPGYDELFVAGGTQAELSGLAFGPKVIEQVNRWAQIYAAGGVASPELFALTQDNDSAHAYDGLGGWTVQNVEIKSFIQGPNGGASAERFGSTWVTVRVALVLAPPAANGPTLRAEYDLLLQPEMNPATPPVTAWGPAGVGPTSELVNFVNNTNG